LSSVGEGKICTGWDWAAFNGVDEYGETCLDFITTTKGNKKKKKKNCFKSVPKLKIGHTS